MSFSADPPHTPPSTAHFALGEHIQTSLLPHCCTNGSLKPADSSPMALLTHAPTIYTHSRSEEPMCVTESLQQREHVEATRGCSHICVALSFCVQRYPWRLWAKLKVSCCAEAKALWAWLHVSSKLPPIMCFTTRCFESRAELVSDMSPFSGAVRDDKPQRWGAKLTCFVSTLNQRHERRSAAASVHMNTSIIFIHSVLERWMDGHWTLADGLCMTAQCWVSPDSVCFSSFVTVASVCAGGTRACGQWLLLLFCHRLWRFVSYIVLYWTGLIIQTQLFCSAQSC